MLTEINVDHGRENQVKEEDEVGYQELRVAQGFKHQVVVGLALVDRVCWF